MSDDDKEAKALASVEKGKRKRKPTKPTKPSETPEAHFSEANKHYYDEKDYEMAAKEFEKSADSEDGYVAAKSLYWLGESYIKLNDLDKAIKAFEHLIKRFENHYLSESAKRRIKAVEALKAV